MPRTRNEKAETVLNDLAELERSAWIFEAAHAKDRDHDEKKEFWVALTGVILSTVVGGTVFASLSGNPDSRLKVLVGCLSLLAAVAAAVNQWAPFAGQSKAHATATAKFASVGCELKEIQRDLKLEELTAREASNQLHELNKEYNNLLQVGPGVSSYDAAKAAWEDRSSSRARADGTRRLGAPIAH